MKAYGPGLEKALVGRPNLFTVETRNAGKVQFVSLIPIIYGTYLVMYLLYLP